MSIKVRLTLLLGLLLIAFLGVLQILRLGENTRVDELRRESTQTGRLTLQQWINLINQPLRRYARDFGEWPETVAFLTQRDPAWADTNLKPALASYEAHALWVLGKNGEVLYSAQQFAGPPLPPPCTPAEFTTMAATGESGHFFAEGRNGLLEVWGEPIGLNQARKDAPGWLLVAKIWDAPFVATLGRLAELNLQLVPVNARPAAGGPPPRLLLPLRDVTGVPLRQLQATLPAVDFAGLLANDTLAVRLLVIFGLLLIASVWLGVRRWVLRPLDQVAASLAREDPALLRSLQHEKTELGRVAQLVGSSFEQKAALIHENEERRRAELALRKSEELVRRSLELRARLARDLHDGVIQSIYAAGLGLESAMSELEHAEPAARTRLAHCRQSLNGVIREVRGFISGLESEQPQRHGFAQELTALARTMQALWPVRIIIKVEPETAGRLSVSQEVHALQSVRECISNALRHGEAREIVITLDQAGGLGILTVTDDGRGFDPTQNSNSGSGLKNLATRAREMGGSLRLDAEPGRGASIIISFTLTEPAA